MSSKRSNSTTTRKTVTDDSKQRGNEATPSGPEFRSVDFSRRETPVLRRPGSIGGVVKLRSSNEVIDPAPYFAAAAAPKPPPSTAAEEKAKGNWYPTKLRPVPAFYPVEKSSRLVEDGVAEVAQRVSACLRILSVQAVYNNDTATAFLYTSENVEMYLSLWKVSGGTKILVELQRRKGDSIAFHRYSRCILDAAIGDFHVDESLLKQGVSIDSIQSKRIERLLQMECKGTATDQENAIIAIEIAHSLLMKDRMDARQLGLESLCLLTDPKKTGKCTAVIASHIVLLGTASGLASGEEEMMFDEAPFQEIRETILSLVQFSRIGEDEFGDDDAAKDEFDDTDFTEGEHMSLLHNLALAVLANALVVVENPEIFEMESEESNKKPAAKQSPSKIADTFMKGTKEISSVNILSTLVQELSKAEKKPHNAHLSARCLKSLCKASDEAKRKAKELGAKTIVSTALEVGARTHLKLEVECKKVEALLNSAT